MAERMARPPAPPPLLKFLLNASAGRGHKGTTASLYASSPLKNYVWELQFTL